MFSFNHPINKLATSKERLFYSSIGFGKTSTCMEFIQRSIAFRKASIEFEKVSIKAKMIFK